ncbi:MAG TPA: lasso peptide biosynthesis PqqD family chaperone, partial [Micromonosporaceae bacterium]|nr:lasso peptide biosynthesis PqqD family chaperone [Micromonosporaceae bacterium]
MTVKLRDGVSVADTDYGVVLLDEASGEFWNLNPTGALVLRALLADGSVEKATRELSEQYAIDRESASRDVQDLVAA